MGWDIKIVQSLIMFFAILMIIASLFGFKKGLSIFLLCVGIREIVNAKEYYDKRQVKWTVASLVVGIGVCMCAFLSLTNLI